MKSADTYLAAVDGPEVEIKVRGSRFLGQVFRARGDDEAADRLAPVRRRHRDATHHCSASRFSPPEAPTERSDDDGEPSGTAGAPMLAMIQKADLFDVAVVVTRYFGGTKLGTGGLARAYSEAAWVALEAAGSVLVWRTRTFAIRATYDDVGRIEATLGRLGGEIRAVARDFAGPPEFRVTVARSRVEVVKSAFVEATAGRSSIVGDERDGTEEERP